MKKIKKFVLSKNLNYDEENEINEHTTKYTNSTNSSVKLNNTNINKVFNYESNFINIFQQKMMVRKFA